MPKTDTASGPGGATAEPMRPVRGRWWAVLLLAALTLAFFREPLLFGRAFYVFDLSIAYLPIQVDNARMRAAGEIPLWNPHLLYGYPINAESEAGGLYPPALVFNLPLPPERAYALYIVLHYVAALAGTMALGRELGLGLVGRLVAAMSFVFGGAFVAQTVNLPLVTTFAWAPLILAWQWRATRTGDLRWALAAGLVLGGSLLGAHPQMTFYTGLLSLMIVALPPGDAAGGRRPYGLAAAALGVVYAVGVGVGAPQLLYNLDFLRHTDRAGELSYEFLTSYSLAPQYLLQLLVPELFGDELRYVGADYFHEQRLFAGLITLGLIAAGLRRAAGAPRCLKLMLIVSAVLALGHFCGLYHLLQHVPGFNLFRAPVRWMLCAGLAGGVVAGFGANALLRGAGAARRAVPAGAVVFGALAILLAGAGFALHGAVHGTGAAAGTNAAGAAGQPVHDSPALRAYDTLTGLWLQNRVNHARSIAPGRFAELLDAAARRAGVSALVSALVCAACAGWWLLARRAAGARATGAALVLLLAFDLWRASGAIHRYESPTFYRDVPATAAFYRTDSERFRVLPVATNPPEATRPGELTYNYGALYQLDMLAANQSVGLEQLTRFDIRPPAMTLAKLALSNVKYIQSRLPLPAHPDLVERTRADGLIIYENKGVLRRLRLVDEYRIAPDAAAALADVQNPQLDPAQTVILEQKPTFPPAGAPPAAPPAARVEVLEYRASRVTAEVETPRRAILALADMHYPGWRCRVDGEPTEILRAYGLVRAIALAPGKHRVEFTYRPRSFYFGLWLSAATLFAAGCAWIAWWRNARRR